METHTKKKERFSNCARELSLGNYKATTSQAVKCNVESRGGKKKSVVCSFSPLNLKKRLSNGFDGKLSSHG